MELTEQEKRDIENEANLIRQRAKEWSQAELKSNPDEYIKRSVHLLLDHYLIFAHKNNFVFNGGQKQIEEFESKIINLINEVKEASKNG